MKLIQLLRPVVPVIVVLSLLSAFNAAAENTRFNLDHYVEEQRQSAHIPCLAVMVIKDGEVIDKAIRGSANLEWNNPCSDQTRFQLASATKLFTGVLLMRLHQLDILNLETTLSTFVKNAPPAFEKITIRHLASHTAGLPEPESQAMSSDIGLYLDWLKNQEAFAEPGTSAQYGIGAYLLLRFVIEQATKISFEQSLQRWVMSPLYMRHSVFDDQQEKMGLKSRKLMSFRSGRYRHDDSGYHVAEAEFPSVANPAGGLFSTPDDLIRFAKAIQADANNLKAMWTAVTLTSGENSGYGVGWTVRSMEGQLAVGHSGGPGLADFLYFPEQQLTVIALSNSMDLYPYVAGRVARHYLPLSNLTQRTAQTDTSALGSWFLANMRALANNDFDPQLVAADVQEHFVPAAIHYFAPMLRALPKANNIERLADMGYGQTNKILLKTWHGSESIVWSVQLDKDGKVLGFGPAEP